MLLIVLLLCILAIYFGNVCNVTVQVCVIAIEFFFYIIVVFCIMDSISIFPTVGGMGTCQILDVGERVRVC